MSDHQQQHFLLGFFMKLMQMHMFKLPSATMMMSYLTLTFVKHFFKYV